MDDCIDQVVQEGTGKEAISGAEVTLSYVGRLGSADGTEFDSGKRFVFKLGAGEVIDGWDRGVVGMRVGEQRNLIVPPKLGYGPEGNPPLIPKNATLFFELELKSAY